MRAQLVELRLEPLEHRGLLRLCAPRRVDGLLLARQPRGTLALELVTGSGRGRAGATDGAGVRDGARAGISVRAGVRAGVRARVRARVRVWVRVREG